MAKKTPEQEEKLKDISRTRTRIKAEREALRRHYDALYQQDAEALEVQLDRAVRDAKDADCKIAWIQEAYPTQDYGTIRRILDRTPSVVAARAEAEVAERYRWHEDETVTVTYHNFGPENVSGVADFEYVTLDEGMPMLSSVETDEGNDVIRVLDGRLDGFYYDDMLDWARRTQ